MTTKTSQVIVVNNDPSTSPKGGIGSKKERSDGLNQVAEKNRKFKKDETNVKAKVQAILEEGTPTTLKIMVFLGAVVALSYGSVYIHECTVKGDTKVNYPMFFMTFPVVLVSVVVIALYAVKYGEGKCWTVVGKYKKDSEKKNDGNSQTKSDTKDTNVTEIKYEISQTVVDAYKQHTVSYGRYVLVCTVMGLLAGSSIIGVFNALATPNDNVWNTFGQIIGSVQLVLGFACLGFLAWMIYSEQKGKAEPTTIVPDSPRSSAGGNSDEENSTEDESP